MTSICSPYIDSKHMELELVLDPFCVSFIFPGSNKQIRASLGVIRPYYEIET